VSLKLQSENLYRVPIDIPMMYLSWGRFRNFTLWQMESLKCDKLECGDEVGRMAGTGEPENPGRFFG